MTVQRKLEVSVHRVEQQNLYLEVVLMAGKLGEEIMDTTFIHYLERQINNSYFYINITELIKSPLWTLIIYIKTVIIALVSEV